MEEKLIKIFKDRVGIDFSEQYEDRDVALLGRKLNIPARELVLILLDVERICGIQLSKEIVAKGGFMTFNRIKQLIENN